MRELVCNNCGGSMMLDASGVTAHCPYCGKKFLLDHADTDYYRDFFARMNSFFAASEDEQTRKQNAEELWNTADIHTFTCADGTPVEVKYMHRYSDGDTDVYVARRNIIFHFKTNGAEKTERFRRSISTLDYPSADTRNLEAFFPKISGGFTLNDGSFLCAITKDEDEYPLRLFGALNGRHAAWIISRLENLCCVLEFSSLVHPQISPDTIYITPYTHQASLYGGWWNAGKNNTLAVDTNERLKLQQNLIGLRDTAAQALGYTKASDIPFTADIPDALRSFIRSVPRPTAYDDFSYWDEMLIKAYGERKFIQMDTNDSQIYGKKGLN